MRNLQVITLELTEQERQALLRVVKAALGEPRYLLSPEVEALRDAWAKLEGVPEDNPAAMSSAHE
jgi:hypothetical protein